MQSAASQIPLFSDAAEPDNWSGFSVRESGRAKRLSIKVYPQGRVEVVVPKRTKPGEVAAFVAENRDWIERSRAAFAAEHVPEPFRLPTRIELPSIERVFGVIYEPQDKSAAVRYRQVGRRGDLLRLAGRTGDASLCVAALKRWLAAIAKTHFGPQLRTLSALTGNPYQRMHVRGQKTCWGSHSSSGTISLNYCLLFLRPALVRYLMIHELCHAAHMDHSPRFWRHVRRFEPNYRRLDRALSDAWKQIPSWVGNY